MIGVIFIGEPFSEVDPSVVTLYEGVHATCLCSQFNFGGVIGEPGGLACIVDGIRVKDVFCV